MGWRKKMNADATVKTFDAGPPTVSDAATFDPAAGCG
jgi:hypothetical protein